VLLGGTWIVEGGAMHHAFFSVKRVHLRTLAITRVIIHESELTPARFDLMRVVFLHEGGMLQSDLTWLLGVSEATVSVMLKSIERRGWVKREVDKIDRRRKRVELTPHGRVCVMHALSVTVTFEEHERTAARSVLGITTPYYDSIAERDDIIDAGKEKLGALIATLANMRKAFLDRAPFPHPWRNTYLPPKVYDWTAPFDLSEAFVTPPHENEVFDESHLYANGEPSLRSDSWLSDEESDERVEH
jgi:DNA-binding MarR family transcriptional regulator